MLLAKRKLNYRKAENRDKRRCKNCNKKQLVDIHALGGEVLKQDWRCPEIGIANSRRYSIQDNMVCDRVEV